MKLDAERRETQLAFAGYGLTIVISLLCGFRMTIPYAYYQLLGADQLSGRLLESLQYLHAQPPLLNLVLGLVLKASDGLGVAPETILLALHLGLGALAVWGFVRLSQRLIESVLIRRVCIALFVLHPAFYMVLFQYFYTLHELVLLCLLPFSAMVCIEGRRIGSYAILCGLSTALVYTHSLFHWAFGAAIMASVGWAALRRSHTPAGRNPVVTRASSATPPHLGGHLLCFGFGLLLLLLWPAKNWLLLDEFSYSTWGGYSLALELPIPYERVPPRQWHVPEEFRHIPALAERNKIDGSKNWNHHSMIGHSQKLGSVARQTLAERPAALLEKARLNYWNYTRFSGRHPYTGEFGTTGDGVPALAAGWARVYELVVYLDPRTATSLAHRARRPARTQSWALSGFVFAFPLLLVAAGVAIYRRWAEIPRSQGFALLLLLTIVLWVLAATLLVDGSEANRIRFPTEPYLLLLAGWSLAGRRPSPNRPPPEARETDGAACTRGAAE